MSAYHFVDSDHCRPPGSMQRIEYELTIRQQPERAKVCTSKEKERRPIDPPPIIQLKITDDRQDPLHNYLQSPHLFICVDLCSVNEGASIPGGINNALAGTSVSSLYRLKDIDNSEAGFFVFGDLSVKLEGHFRLRFYLFEVQKGEVCYLQSITSAVFTVWSAKQFPGMLDSTFLSRSFSDQGVRIRIRKEHRIKMKRPTQRGQLSPELQASYAIQDQRPPVSHVSPQYSTTNSQQGHIYENRANLDFHYSGAPVRVHGPRQVEYHPYPRPSQPYPSNYIDRSPYQEATHLPPNYPGPSPYSSGPHTSEYGQPSNFGKAHKSHPQGGEYYYSQENRGVPPPPSALPYGSYPDRRQNPYPDPQARPYPPEQRSYPSDTRSQNPYSSESSRSAMYIDSRPPSSHVIGPSPQYYGHGSSRRSEPSARTHWSQESQRISSESSRVDLPAQGQYSGTPRLHQPHERRESRHSLNAILSEEGRRSSPRPGSRPGSDSTSQGETSPRIRQHPQDRDQERVKLPPLRRGSAGETEGEAIQGRSNSNLWKLVDAATEL